MSYQPSLTSITINNTNDIQTAIDLIASQGGGTVNFETQTFNVASTITIPSNITLDGNGATIDFGGTASQILLQGTDPYATGTIAVNYGETAVTGMGTTWTAGMAGQSILLGDYWYPIASVTDATHLILDANFIGTNLSGDTYVIATTVNVSEVKNLTVTNSSIELVKFRYVNTIRLVSLSLTNGLTGLSGSDSNNIYFLDASFVDSCSSGGIVLNNVPFCVFDNYLVSNVTGPGMQLTRVSNTAISTFSLQGITGVGLSFTNCYDIGLVNYAFIGISSHGIEYVSGNSDLEAIEGYISSCGGDGIKFTGTSNRIVLSQNSLVNCSGYGVNISSATCAGNIVSGNGFSNNTSGPIQDLGTDSVVENNAGFQTTLSQSSNYTLTAIDKVILCTGTMTATLPTAVGRTGKRYVVKNAGTGVITINTTASQTIDGTLTRTLAFPNQALEIVSNGSNWFILTSL